jgi:hypothetical protein
VGRNLRAEHLPARGSSLFHTSTIDQPGLDCAGIGCWPSRPRAGAGSAISPGFQRCGSAAVPKVGRAARDLPHRPARLSSSWTGGKMFAVGTRAYFVFAQEAEKWRRQSGESFIPAGPNPPPLQPPWLPR